ncbi:MAG: amidophosphoribosyltransferase [Kiritimatiellae bacterium]|nr:amidophosphoribosyltransferase [Kiritimatiellia bacterium]
MSDELKHECAVAMVVLRKPASATSDYGGTKLSLLLEKQHNRGQDGAGAAIIRANPEPGEMPYWVAKSASSTPLADILGAIGKRTCGKDERIFLGHLRYATFGKNEVAFCHPFVHEASELANTVLLAGNFNLTNTAALFERYRSEGEFPTSRADGYLVCEMIAHELRSAAYGGSLLRAVEKALAGADGAWTLCGATADGRAFALRDAHGIRPGWYFINDDVVVVASERPAIQAAFDVPPEAVKELPRGVALTVSPTGGVEFVQVLPPAPARECVFERIYFSRANDAAIHRERMALGAALVPDVLKAADSPLEDIFFSYIPNSARTAFHGLLEALFVECLTQSSQSPQSEKLEATSRSLRTSRATFIPRFGEVIVKDAKFRTFIADAAARREFYKHVYDVTYGLVRTGRDTLVVLDDSIVRGNTMKSAILPMLDRLGPKRIVVASSAPPIRYPDCYGIDMSTLGELVAFKALVKLLGDAASSCLRTRPLPELYSQFTGEQHCAEIANLLTPPGMKAEVKVVFQSLEALRESCPGSRGDWYFTGDYPTPGGCKVLATAVENYLERNNGRSY